MPAQTRVRSGTSDQGTRRPPPAPTTSETMRSPLPLSQALPNGAPQRGEGGAMIAAEVITAAAVGHGSHQKSLVRAEIISRIGFRKLAMNVAADGDDIEHGDAEIADLASFGMRGIARHRQRLQEHLRRHDRRPEAQRHSALEILHGARVDQEIEIRSEEHTSELQ